MTAIQRKVIGLPESFLRGRRPPGATADRRLRCKPRAAFPLRARNAPQLLTRTQPLPQATLLTCLFPSASLLPNVSAVSRVPGRTVTPGDDVRGVGRKG